MSKLFLVALATITKDAGTQFRVKLDADAIKTYSASYAEWMAKNTEEDKKKPMQEWDKCPLEAPVLFKTPDGKLILVDGFHRDKAAMMAKLDALFFEIKEGTEQEAQEYALAANSKHGVRLTKEDMHRKLKRALELWPEKSNVQIAKSIGGTEFWVRQHRPVSKSGAVRTVKRGGKEVKVNTSGIGKKGGNKRVKASAAKKAAGKGSKSGSKSQSAGAADEFQEEATKGSPGTPAAASSTGKTFDDETNKAIARLAKVLGDAGLTKPDAFVSALQDGSLEIPVREVKVWAQTSPDRIREAYPLITDRKMSPSAAFKFLDCQPDGNTKISHLLNLALAKGGIALERVEGCIIVVAFEDTTTMKRNIPLQGVTLVPKKHEKEYLAALLEK